MATITLTKKYTPPSAESAPLPTYPLQQPAPAKLHIKIDEHWYDLTQWQHTHPGGSTVLSYLHGQDCSDAFYSLHSEGAIRRLARLPRKTQTPAGCVEPVPSKATLAFRELRAQFKKEGLFNRNVFIETLYFLSAFLFCGIGSYLTYSGGSSLLAILFIGLGMQQAGWIGHDYCHGRGMNCYYLSRSYSGLINAFSPTWWSDKHNTHHVYTNYVGIDGDIANEPIFHLFAPSTDSDVWYRRYQHIFMAPAYSFLYVSWRIASLTWVYTHGEYKEFAFMVLNYIWLWTLGPVVAFGSILVGGFLVAIIVTATHQSEEMIPGNIHEQTDAQYSFVECQFATTRDARTGGGMMEWLWGGMDFQLEHHLFPTMPKYNYRKIVDRVKQFARANGLEYREDTMMEILDRNIATLKQAGSLPAHKSQ